MFPVDTDTQEDSEAEDAIWVHDFLPNKIDLFIYVFTYLFTVF